MTRWLVLALVAFLVSATLWIAHEVYEQSRREQARCQQVLRQELRWKPWAVSLRLPADPCAAIRVVRGGR